MARVIFRSAHYACAADDCCMSPWFRTDSGMMQSGVPEAMPGMNLSRRRIQNYPLRTTLGLYMVAHESIRFQELCLPIHWVRSTASHLHRPHEAYPCQRYNKKLLTLQAMSAVIVKSVSCVLFDAEDLGEGIHQCNAFLVLHEEYAGEADERDQIPNENINFGKHSACSLSDRLI